MRQDILREWKEYKEKQEREFKERQKIDKYKENIRKDIITHYLKNVLGVSEFNTNGYWYHFCYKGYYIDFVDQEERICGEMFIKPETKEEWEMIRELSSIMYSIQFSYPYLARKIINAYDYDSFVFEGSTEKIVSKGSAFDRFLRKKVGI